MSEETARDLREARHIETQRRAAADEAKQALLDKIADEVPARLDAHGKKVAHEQPDVTTAMGNDGVRAFRAELRFGAEALADDLRRSADAIDWMKDFGRRDAVKSAVFHYVYGRRATAIDAVVRKHGYTVPEHGGFHPHSLYEIAWFQEATAALQALVSAQDNVRAAKEADDRDSVEQLWNDDPV